MKKYTIKEFAEGKKAVKIENEEQWNKLNKVHKLCTIDSRNIGYYFNNIHEWCEKDWYERNGYETLEFSQLDFEDELVVGKWYKLPKTSNYYAKYKTMQSCSEYISNTGSHSHWDGNCNFEDAIKIDLSEIQQYLPSNHSDLIKKDTFVLPEKWIVEVTSENRAVINTWKIKQRYNDDLFANINYSHVHYDGSGGMNICHNERIITFEQFKTYILKEKTIEKEIIGYKLVKPKYEMASIKLLGWNLTTKLLINISEKGDIHRLKEAGVLDLWFEAVYAPKYSLPTINSYQGSYENGIIKYDCAEFSKMFFEHLNSTNSHLGNRTIKSIELSSGVKITIEEIKQIVEYINNNK